jgi:hypothetical protein
MVQQQIKLLRIGKKKSDNTLALQAAHSAVDGYTVLIVVTDYHNTCNGKKWHIERRIL